MCIIVQPYLVSYLVIHPWFTVLIFQPGQPKSDQKTTLGNLTYF